MPLTVLERGDLERLRSRVGRLFLALQEAADLVGAEKPGAWLPPADLCESPSCVTVRVELPGVRPEHMQVSLSGGHLRVTGRKRKGAPRAVISHLCSERSYGQFSRSIPLRWPVRAQEATAELRDGLLTVRLPKIQERRGGEIKIEVKSDR
ncbi:MAG TPA: Hsp20/alpha crystallin family protein [Pyrinomonadaceae bacterium]|nr:Hsp20/alpha crystallin family protein [Pyrinomonadaceae bacterium]